MLVLRFSIVHFQDQVRPVIGLRQLDEIESLALTFELGRNFCFAKFALELFPDKACAKWILISVYFDSEPCFKTV